VTRLKTGINEVLNPVGARELSPERADLLQNPSIERASGVYFPRIRLLRRETASYNDPTRL